jgi:hypothetical protein
MNRGLLILAAVLMSGCAGHRLSEAGSAVRIVSSDAAVAGTPMMASTTGTFGALRTNEIDAWARNWGASVGASTVKITVNHGPHLSTVVAEAY